MQKQDYEEAINVQDACNLSGVIFEWAEIMQRICDESHKDGKGTDWKNNHPINVLFAHKVYDMVNVHSSLSYDGIFNRAYKDVVKLLTQWEETV